MGWVCGGGFAEFEKLRYLIKTAHSAVNSSTNQPTSSGAASATVTEHDGKSSSGECVHQRD